MDLDFISGEIVDSAVKLHVRVGPGLLESVYEVLLANDLVRRGLFVERQVTVPVELDGARFKKALRLDLLVERSVVVEIKAVEQVTSAHLKQVTTYLRIMDLRVGLLLNFSGATLKEGLFRLVNRYVPSAPSRLRVNQNVSAAPVPEDPPRLRGGGGKPKELPQPAGSRSLMT